MTHKGSRRDVECFKITLYKNSFLPLSLLICRLSRSDHFSESGAVLPSSMLQGVLRKNDLHVSWPKFQRPKVINLCLNCKSNVQGKEIYSGIRTAVTITYCVIICGYYTEGKK